VSLLRQSSLRREGRAWTVSLVVVLMLALVGAGCGDTTPKSDADLQDEAMELVPPSASVLDVNVISDDSGVNPTKRVEIDLRLPGHSGSDRVAAYIVAGKKHGWKQGGFSSDDLSKDGLSAEYLIGVPTASEDQIAVSVNG
jgi:hypothetical protein